MGKHIKPGVYVKTIDESSFIPEGLDFPEFVEEFASAISSKIKTKHKYDIIDYTIRFWANNITGDGDVLIGMVVGVSMHPEYISVYRGVVAERFSYTDKDIIEKTASFVDYQLNRESTREDEITLLVGRMFPIVSTDGPGNSPFYISTQEEFDKIYGKP